MSEDPTYANVVSTVALGVAGASLLWQILRAVRWDRPKLSVSGRLMFSGSTDSVTRARIHSWDLEVVVANIGDAVTKLVEVYWEVERPGEAAFRVRGTAPSDGTINLETHGETRVIVGDFEPELPLSLGRNDVAQWTFAWPTESLPLMAGSTRGRPVVVSVARSKRASERGGNPHLTNAYGEWQVVPDDTEIRRVVASTGDSYGSTFPNSSGR